MSDDDAILATRAFVSELRLGSTVTTDQIREHREHLCDELERLGFDLQQLHGGRWHRVIPRAAEAPKPRVHVRRAFDRVMMTVKGRNGIAGIMLARTEVHALAVRLLEASVPSSADDIVAEGVAEAVDAFGLVDAGRVGAELQRATAAERDAVELAEHYARRADAMAQVLQPLMMVCEWLAECAESRSEDLLEEATTMAREVLPRLRALGGKVDDV